MNSWIGIRWGPQNIWALFPSLHQGKWSCNIGTHVGIAEMNKYLPDQHTIHFDPVFGSSVLYLTGNHCLQFMHTQTVVVNIRKKSLKLRRKWQVIAKHWCKHWVPIREVSIDIPTNPLPSTSQNHLVASGIIDAFGMFKVSGFAEDTTLASHSNGFYMDPCIIRKAIRTIWYWDIELYAYQTS